MTWGTSYFTSRAAANRYYRDYGDGPEDVARKIREGSIHIGKPPLKAGQRLIRVDGGMRWGIEEKSNPARRGMAKRKKKTTKRKRRNPISLSPIRKILKEAKARRVRVMRSKSGKPTGLKFL